MKRIILFSILTIFITTAFSQYKKVKIDSNIAKLKKIEIEPIKSKIFVQPLSKEIIITKNTSKWNRILINFSKNHEIAEDVQKIKKEKTELKLKNKKDYYPDENEVKSNKNNPTIGVNFEANWFDGYIPPDNSIAISNSGYIVSVTNSTIEYYDASGNFLYTSFFDDFFNDDELNSNIYDPVVLYDSGSDRFFMVVLHGSSSSTSKVLVCFSKTNNPLDGWWFYKFPGDPLNDNSWFDYPKIGVSTNEVYITGNLYDNSNNFKQSVIYQLDKYDGYAGNPVSWQYWHNISETPFTVVPASYGQYGNYGPGIYLISTDENGILTDKFRLYDLTDDMTGNPEINVYSIDADFSLAGDALQQGTSILLETGDNRMLSAFYLNGILHFVFHSEYTNAYNGINYNRLTISSLSNWNSKFGLDGYDYSYPSVASYGNDENDKSVIICFLRSSSSIYPEVRVVKCDNNGNWSGSTLVKNGETYVDYLPNNDGISRWGDYTGISRKQNASPPEVWVSGGFGKYRDGFNAYDTWIAQIVDVTTDLKKPENNYNTTKSKIYPNPIYNMFNIDFYLENNSYVEITLKDIKGSIVKVLYKDKVYKGHNRFSFNKGALKQGTYFVTIRTDNKVLKNEKVIVK